MRPIALPLTSAPEPRVRPARSRRPWGGSSDTRRPRGVPRRGAYPQAASGRPDWSPPSATLWLSVECGRGISPNRPCDRSTPSQARHGVRIANRMLDHGLRFARVGKRKWRRTPTPRRRRPRRSLKLRFREIRRKAVHKIYYFSSIYCHKCHIAAYNTAERSGKRSGYAATETLTCTPGGVNENIYIEDLAFSCHRDRCVFSCAAGAVSDRRRQHGHRLPSRLHAE